VIVELLERGASLAALAGYADEARQGLGRLVLVAGEAGVGKSALVEQLHSDLPDARWSRGPAMACSPRARWGRCSTWPPSWAGSWMSCAGPARSARICSALYCARSASRAR